MEYRYLVKTFTGLEGVLADELRQLDASDIRIVRRGVMCTGSRKLLYRCNLELRCGLRVYQHLVDFSANSPEALYKAAVDYDWRQFMKVTSTFVVTSSASHTPWVRNTMFAALKTKDGVVDRMREGELRPSIDKERADFRIHTYIFKGEGSFWIDSTGDPLFKRGYRLRTVPAPMNEVLAAGILKLAGYKPTRPLMDPMCGSGTFAIEAARMGLNLPSQDGRRDFAFMNWPDFDPTDWKVVRAQANARVHRGAIATIYAADVDHRAVSFAEKNIREAGLGPHIKLAERDFFELQPPAKEGLLIMNPPYDERLSVNMGARWYGDVGRQLKFNWAGWDAWIVSSFEEGMRALRLRPEETIPLDNGGLPVELWHLTLYAGSSAEV